MELSCSEIDQVTAYMCMCCAVLSCVQLDSVHRDSPGKNIGVGCHVPLQGIFQTQESNWGLLHCRQILYQLSYEGSLVITIV